jgi:signal transduction histidine kinase
LRGQFYKPSDFGNAETPPPPMKPYSGIFKQMVICFLLLSAQAPAQNQIAVSLQWLADRTHKTYRHTDSIVLESNQNNLLVSFETPNKNAAKFFCELKDGVSAKDTFTAPNQIILKNLTGGTYQLKVIDLQTKASSTIRFTIKLLQWQQGWFLPLVYFLILLFVSAIVYLFAMYKFRQQIQLQQVRNEIASDLHDDVGSTLSNISFLGEMAKMKLTKKTEDVLPILERIMEESKEMVQTMRGMVWTIQPDNDRAVDFIDKIRSFATEMLQNRAIVLQFNNEIPENQLLTIEQQRNLFLIFKELIHNIAKHSVATRVTISFKKHEHWLWAKVTDNGQGYDTTQISEGNGLRNLQQRITQLEGKMEIESGVEKGTVTKMMIPL